MVSIRVSIVSMVGISIVVWVTIVSIGSISSGLGISRPLAIEMSVMVGIWVSIVSMVGIAKMVSVSIGTIDDSGISFRLGISRPLAIVMSIMVGIRVSIVTMVGKMVSISIVSIEITSISTCFSFTGSSGEHAQGSNSNGFHHFVFAS